MTPKLTITRNRVRNHFHYFWWQYVILIVASFFLWNLLYNMTHYRSPEHLKVEWYYEGAVSYESQERLDQLLHQLTPELFPDMEEVTFTVVGVDANYGAMQLMVWMSAGQGDLYMLGTDNFKSHAASGAMVDLQPYVDNGTLHVDGIDLSKGYVRNEETGEKHLYGIPAASLTGLREEYGLEPENTYMSLLITGGNTDNTIKLMNWLLDNMR